jgi:hypothetical protein
MIMQEKVKPKNAHEKLQLRPRVRRSLDGEIGGGAEVCCRKT